MREQSETPRTDKFYASFADGECIPNQDEWLALCQSLESQLTAATDQLKNAQAELLKMSLREQLLHGDYKFEKNRADEALLELNAVTEQRDMLAEALNDLYHHYSLTDPAYTLIEQALQSLSTNVTTHTPGDNEKPLK